MMKKVYVSTVIAIALLASWRIADAAEYGSPAFARDTPATTAIRDFLHSMLVPLDTVTAPVNAAVRPLTGNEQFDSKDNLPKMRAAPQPVDTNAGLTSRQTPDPKEGR